MPRTGKHPLKIAGTSLEHQHRQVTIVTVVHIPMLAGYWEESLNVLRLFFESLYASTNISFDLMVFDNNSCAQVQNYLLDLRRGKKIQYLVLSEYNLKKLGAMNYLFSCAPGEYVAFADSDVYFLPGWLEESLKILETFPEAGQVSALPTIDKRAHYIQSTLCGLETSVNLNIKRGQLIPQSYMKAHCLSIGREKDEYMQNAGLGEDIRITRGDVSAYVSAQDFQFVTRREVIQQVLPLEVRHAGEYYDSIYSPIFEAKIDEHGWWRLSTLHYRVHHMGNHMPDLEEELAGIADISTKGKPTSRATAQTSLRARILYSRPIRTALKRIYTWAYSLLFEQA